MTGPAEALLAETGFEAGREVSAIASRAGTPPASSNRTRIVAGARARAANPGVIFSPLIFSPRRQGAGPCQGPRSASGNE